MADPRASVRFDEADYPGTTRTYLIDDSTITYDSTKANGSAQVGLAVRLVPATAKTVELVGDGEQVEGELKAVFADNTCVVKHKGVVTLKGGDGATLTIGEKIVGDLGAAAAEGYVRAVATGTAAELGHARGRILDATDTEAVKVDL